MASLAGWWPMFVVVLVGILYAEGLRSAAARGRPYPKPRAVAFAGGLAAVAVALGGPVEAYADVLLSVHMAQHLLLTLVAAPLLALGAPVSLALRSSVPVRRPVLAVVRSRPARVLAHPLVAWVAFGAGMFAVHFTALYEAALASPWIHALEHVLFLALGWLFWAPVVARDGAPGVRLSEPVRMLYLATAAPLQALLALAIVSASAPLYPHYAKLPGRPREAAVVDQGLAGVVMWLAGAMILTIALLLVATSWRRSEQARDRARGGGLRRHAA